MKAEQKGPRLRTVEKYKPPYALNSFPPKFAIRLAREIVYLLASRGTPRLEGNDWEEIFARLIGAKWKPSNVGLDDVVLEQTAWAAKTVKHSRPSAASCVRLISGRNSPVYSFGESDVTPKNAPNLGRQIVDIWNERVSAVKKNYKHLRTVVLVKSADLLDLAVFEFNTERYDAELFDWGWNSRRNLEGISKRSGDHVFTWQPHGSQFTIITPIPENRLALRIRQPTRLDRERVLDALGFNESWVQVLE